jgi:hypothetical protein
MAKFVCITPEHFEKISKYIIDHPPSFKEIEAAAVVKNIILNHSPLIDVNFDKNKDGDKKDKV